MLAIDLGYGFKLPKGGINKVLILILMMISSFLIIPLIWWLGYVADVLSSAIKNEKDLPSFKFSKQMKFGLVVVGLEIFYLFIPLVVMGFNAWVGYVLLLLAMFILPIAICNYLVKKGAFNFSEHFFVVGKNPKGFFSAYGLFLLFEVLFIFAQYMVIIDPVLLLIFMVLILPYFAVVFARLYGFA